MSPKVEAWRKLHAIKEYCFKYGSVDEVVRFINDQGIECQMRGAWKRNKGEIWAVKGEVRMRIGTLYENTYYCMCAVIKLPIIEQLKLEL